MAYTVNTMDTNQTAPKVRSRPIRVHGVCFRDKISLGAFEICSRCNKQGCI